MVGPMIIIAKQGVRKYLYIYLKNVPFHGLENFRFARMRIIRWYRKLSHAREVFQSKDFVLFCHKVDVCLYNSYVVVKQKKEKFNL